MLRSFALIGTVLFSVNVSAELQPISDQELSEVSGQAAVAFDVNETASSKFTRFTMGMDIEAQVNIDNVVLGEYALAGETAAADFQAQHLSLGHISTDATKIQLDGQTYALNEIVPFEAIDPYFEIVQNNAGNLTGFRMGFNQARGTFSGDIQSLSGNIGLKLDDGSGVIKDARLLNDTGVADNIRATHIGLEDASTDCAAGVLCAPLSNLKTLDIGKAEADGSVSMTDEFFFSFQTQAIDWATQSGGVRAGPGAFVNIPTSMQLDLNQLQTGVPRARTEYIDRGLGLF